MLFSNGKEIYSGASFNNPIYANKWVIDIDLEINDCKIDVTIDEFSFTPEGSISGGYNREPKNNLVPDDNDQNDAYTC